MEVRDRLGRVLLQELRRPRPLHRRLEAISRQRRRLPRREAGPRRRVFLVPRPPRRACSRARLRRRSQFDGSAPPRPKRHHRPLQGSGRRGRGRRRRCHCHCCCGGRRCAGLLSRRRRRRTASSPKEDEGGSAAAADSPGADSSETATTTSTGDSFAAELVPAGGGGGGGAAGGGEVDVLSDARAAVRGIVHALLPGRAEDATEGRTGRLSTDQAGPQRLRGPHQRRRRAARALGPHRAADAGGLGGGARVRLGRH
mmetsp:Transcript_3134/g.9542  ORF Transcript_3134/g.9542 Transcript_3134/m.9542 type:complete len:256 (+) Transcript_3134:1048-1815(+)